MDKFKSRKFSLVCPSCLREFDGDNRRYKLKSHIGLIHYRHEIIAEFDNYFGNNSCKICQKTVDSIHKKQIHLIFNHSNYAAKLACLVKELSPDIKSTPVPVVLREENVKSKVLKKDKKNASKELQKQKSLIDFSGQNDSVASNIQERLMVNTFDDETGNDEENENNHNFLQEQLLLDQDLSDDEEDNLNKRKDDEDDTKTQSNLLADQNLSDYDDDFKSNGEENESQIQLNIDSEVNNESNFNKEEDEANIQFNLLADQDMSDDDENDDIDNTDNEYKNIENDEPITKRNVSTHQDLSDDSCITRVDEEYALIQLNLLADQDMSDDDENDDIDNKFDKEEYENSKNQLLADDDTMNNMEEEDEALIQLNLLADQEISDDEE